MKRETPVTFLVGLIVACLLSFGAMGSMISGLQLPVDNMEHLFLAWALSALVGGALSLLKRGYIPILVLSVLGMWYLWEYQYISLPIRALITRLSVIYDSAYNWGVLEFTGVNWERVPLDLPLGFFGCLISLTAAEAMVRGKGLIAPVGLAMMPLTAALICTNTVPDPQYLYMLIFAVIELVLTATVRRHSPHQGAKLAILTTLPVSLLMGLLFTAYPKDTYVNRSEEQLDAVVDWWNSLALFNGDTTGLINQTPAGPNATATTNLRRVGPRNIRDYPVMEVTSERGGTVYLRGQDFDDYDGLSWDSSALRSEELTPPRGLRSSVTVQTLRPMNVLYIPYHPAGGQTIVGGRVENTDDRTEYTFEVVASVDKYLSSGTTIELGQTVIIDTEIIGGEIISDEFIGDEMLDAVGEIVAGVGTPEDMDYADLKYRYTLLTAETQAWAEDYVARILPATTEALSDAVIARTIADHVRASALYDTDTSRMNLDYEDFAQWFLEESDTGYCVHFATATAVLLRAAGVPARYVTGYMVSCEAGQTTTVTADMAHAWVEYYDSGTWQVLESTPADLRDQETEPPTAPTEPEYATEPPTDPEDATRPSAPLPGDKNDPKIDLSGLWTALKWVPALGALVLAAFGQYRLRRDHRRRRLARSKPNTRALCLWQETELLCRVTKQEPPEDLHTLAQKAKFSQHALTREELGSFEAWLDTEREKLKQSPWYLRLLYRYVLALW